MLLNICLERRKISFVENLLGAVFTRPVLVDLDPVDAPLPSEQPVSKELLCDSAGLRDIDAFVDT